MQKVVRKWFLELCSSCGRRVHVKATSLVWVCPVSLLHFIPHLFPTPFSVISLNGFLRETFKRKILNSVLKHKVWLNSFSISILISTFIFFVTHHSDLPSLLLWRPVFSLSLLSWITELFIVKSGFNPVFLSAYLLRTKPRKDREEEEEVCEDWWGLPTKAGSE